MSPTVDLAVVVPGNDEEQTFHTLLTRRLLSLGLRSVNHRILRHPQRDAGCYRSGVDLLSPFRQQAGHGLILFDRDGSGQESRPAGEIEADVHTRLVRAGWGHRAEVLVLDPELEIWVWSDSPNVDEALGWRGRLPRLRQWLETEGRWAAGRSKPENPKECLEAALREARIRRSSSIYASLAETVGLDRCTDPGFRRLRDLLRRWSPATE